MPPEVSSRCCKASCSAPAKFVIISGNEYPVCKEHMNEAMRIIRDMAAEPTLVRLVVLRPGEE